MLILHKFQESLALEEDNQKPVKQAEPKLLDVCNLKPQQVCF